MITEITLKPVVKIINAEDHEKAMKILQKSEAACLYFQLNKIQDYPGSGGCLGTKVVWVWSTWNFNSNKPFIVIGEPE